MHHDRLMAMPCITADPPAPLLRVLRRMLGEDLTAIRTGPSRVLCLLAGHEVDKRVVTGAITRGLIREAGDHGDDSTVYTITADGKRWAKTEGGAE